jgi:mono/diheme cytochrome c family protein
LRLQALGVGLLVLVAGCRQDMHDQPRYKPLAKSDFFTDGRSARPLVPGTVARGEDHLQENSAFYAGKDGAAHVAQLPVELTADLLARGRQRYEIYCSPCHDRTGSGEGMVVKRGYRQPTTFHVDRLRQAPPGYFFDVMTNGFGAMPDYRAQIGVRDRWAIVAYIRALQLSQHATVADVPERDRATLDAPAAPPAPAAAPKEHR